jgi:hypothetical protein
VYHDFIPPGQISQRLSDTVRRKRRDTVSAQSHTALVVPSPSSLLCKLCRGRFLHRATQRLLYHHPVRYCASCAKEGFCTEPYSACCAITQFVTVQAVQRKVSAPSHTALVVPSPSSLLCKLCRGRFLHRATQRLLCGSSFAENIPFNTQPPHSPDLAPNVFGYSLLWKWD